MPSERPMLKSNENRRSNKPIMEKRRRARINSCLNELKALILEALKKDPARHSKLEKADILEMTVKHLQNLQRQQIALQTASNPNVTNKFRAGYNECATEVSRYLRQMDGMDTGAQQRLLGHLSNCIDFLNRPETLHRSSTQPLNIRVTSLLEGPVGELTPLTTPNVLDKSPLGFHLLPTRIVNGELALVLPTNPNVVVKNPIQEPNERLTFGSNLLAVAPMLTEKLSPFCDENSFDNVYSGNKTMLIPAATSAVDLCTGSAASMVTSKGPWRPW